MLTTEAAVQAEGVEVRRELAETVVASADSADLSVWGWSDYLALVGGTGYAYFDVCNDGPLPATGVELSLGLSGPAQITGVTAPYWYGETPPACSFSAAGAACLLDEPYDCLPFDVEFLPTEEGVIWITASVNGEQDDPFPENNADHA
jgi:hypothetical protein